MNWVEKLFGVEAEQTSKEEHDKANQTQVEIMYEYLLSQGVTQDITPTQEQLNRDTQQVSEFNAIKDAK